MAPTTPKRHRQAAELPLSPPVTPQKASLGLLVFSDVLENESTTTQEEFETNDYDSNDSETSTEYLEDDSDDELLRYACDAREIAADLDITIEDKPIPYITACAQFPAGAAINLPHLINADAGFTEETFPSGVRLPDGVATLLWHFNPHAAQLFLDLSIENVELIRTDESNFYCDLAVARKGNEVRVGYFNRIPTDVDGEQFTLYEWDCQVRATIQPSGIWLMNFATHCGLSDSIFGLYENDSYGYYQHSPIQQSRVYEIARQLATCLVVRKPWLKSPGVEIKMSIS